MKSTPSLMTLLAFAACLCLASGFAPRAQPLGRSITSHGGGAARRVPPLFGFLGDKERDTLSRETEPNEYFKT